MLTSVPGWKYAAWPFAKNFIAGETIEEAVAKGHALKKLGYKVIYNFATEEVGGDIVKIGEITNTYLTLIDRIDKTDALSLKLSQFGQDKCSSVGEAFGVHNLLEVLLKAQSKSIRVWIDAERLAYRQCYSDFLANLLARDYNNIGRVIQAYGPSWDWEWFIKKCALEASMPVRICKGAYRNDPAALDVEKKYEIVSAQFDYAVNEFLSRGIEVEIATHDERKINFWKNRIGHELTAHFAMLLGVRPDLAKSLKEGKKGMHIYITFGDNWAGYVKRRIIENPDYIWLPFEKKEAY